MLLLVHGSAAHLAGWIESCSCHNELRKQCTSRAQWEVVLQRVFDDSNVSFCPLSGMRAPEVACGDLEHEYTLSSCLDSLFDGTTAKQFSLTEEQWHVVTSDFERARNCFQMTLQLKMQPWKALPWHLHGLAHSSEEKARTCAQRCLDLYADAPQHQDHALTLEWLAETSGKRQYVQDFAAGASRDSLPTHIQDAISLFKYTNLAERIVEAQHKNVKKDAGYNQGSAMAVSASIRSNPHSLAMQANDEFSQQFFHCLHRARQTRKLPTHLGIQCHPDIVGFSGTSRELKERLCTLVPKIVYRCDTEAAFADLSSALEDHKRIKARTQQRALRTFANTSRTLASQLWLHVLDHLRTSYSEGQVLCSRNLRHMDFAAAWTLHNLDAAGTTDGAEDDGVIEYFRVVKVGRGRKFARG
eukprot:6482465-Amphidinium_carterae.2